MIPDGLQHAGPPAVTEPGLILARLRRETRIAHEALEHTLGLLDRALSLQAYRNILARFYGFWIGWQPEAARCLNDEGLTAPRRRLHHLAADLSALGLTEADLAALPRCPPPILDGPLEALGSLYVMEGSTLGGRIITRNLAACFGEAVSTQYFAGYGAGTGTMWRTFLAELDRIHPAGAARVVTGANLTFERLGHWLHRQTPGEPPPGTP